ncbi:MAG: glycosyltransferase family 4 protein, partial [Pseudonocardiaceae bacterium]
GVAADRVVRIPNGVDTTRFRPASPSEKTELRQRLGIAAGPVAIYAGRLVSYKGLPLLLRVWHGLGERLPAATLVLVGEGGNDMHACEAELKTYVADHGMGSKVLFTGAVEHVEDWLRAADIFVFPTENEAFGLALVEGMACGLAAVTTAVGGIGDFVVDGCNGLVVQPRDCNGMRASLELLLADRGRAAELGRNARETATRQFGEEPVAGAYEALFRTTLRERRRAAA